MYNNCNISGIRISGPQIEKYPKIQITATYTLWENRKGKEVFEVKCY